MFRHVWCIVPNNFLSSNVIYPLPALSSLFSSYDSLGCFKAITFFHIHKTIHPSCKGKNKGGCCCCLVNVVMFAKMLIYFGWCHQEENTYLQCASWCVRRASSGLCGLQSCWQWPRSHWSGPLKTFYVHCSAALGHLYGLRTPRGLYSYPPDAGSQCHGHTVWHLKRKTQCLYKWLQNNEGQHKSTKTNKQKEPNQALFVASSSLILV